MSMPPLWSYQDIAVKEITKHLKTEDSAVLSVCPSGGKTFMALHIAQPYLDRGDI
jgi:superfamily II DNA or RNA helicase